MCAEQGRLEDAERAYREAIRLKPDSLTARAALPGVLLAGGRHAEAETAAPAPPAPNFQVARAHFDLWQAPQGRRDWARPAGATAAVPPRLPQHSPAPARPAPP